MKNSKFIYLLPLVTAIAAFSCKKTDPAPEETQNDNPQEQITRVVLTFTNQQNNQDILTAEWSDPDGEGGNPPNLPDPVVLTGGATYDLTIDFFDDINNKNITKEVSEEGDEHQLFFTGDAVNLVNFNYADADKNNDPIGLLVTAEAANVGGPNALTLTLKHQPDGTKDGNINTGETDAEIDFPVAVQ